jgi:hypothetical protein
MTIILILIAMYLALPLSRNKAKRSYSAWMRSRKEYNKRYSTGKNEPNFFQNYGMFKEL